MMTAHRLATLAAFALATLVASAGATLAASDSDCPEGYIAVDSNGYGNSIKLGTEGADEYIAIDQWGNEHHLKGRLEGDCLALVAGQSGENNDAVFTILGKEIAVGMIQRGDSDLEVTAIGEGIVVGGDLAEGTEADITAIGFDINISIEQSV